MHREQSEASLEITVGKDGAVMIPPNVRSLFGIAEGTRILLQVDGNPPRIVLVPVTREYIHAFRGILKHTPEGEALQRRRKAETFLGHQRKKGSRRVNRRRSR